MEGGEGGERAILCERKVAPSAPSLPPPLQTRGRLRWVLGLGGISAGHRHTPGALFGPGSEIDSFWASGQQQQARAPAVASQTFIDSDSQESSPSFVFCILFVFSF